MKRYCEHRIERWRNRVAPNPVKLEKSAEQQREEQVEQQEQEQAEQQEQEQAEQQVGGAWTDNPVSEVHGHLGCNNKLFIHR